jgi:predicted nucleotide-binding protein (sugar kinase/HSP70/actin superfamily)
MYIYFYIYDYVYDFQIFCFHKKLRRSVCVYVCMYVYHVVLNVLNANLTETLASRGVT